MRAAAIQTPILILTAREAVEHRVAGLNAGADDYLVKPFATAELVARVKALLRLPGAPLGIVLEAGNIRFDTVGRDVQIAGTTIHLPRRETEILEYLMRRLGRVVRPSRCSRRGCTEPMRSSSRTRSQSICTTCAVSS
jgi:DNA-binding response OmpR family regulator